MHIEYIAWSIILTPIVAFALIRRAGAYLGRSLVACTAITGASLSFFSSSFLASKVFFEGYQQHISGFTWLTCGNILTFKTGLWIDPLSVTLMLVISSISLMVHIYSVSYMREDPNYTRYFSELSLFTFAMLTLVSADNVLQLFFGWEIVGLASYLLIGFWFQKAEAQNAALKAFLINRAGDIGLLLGLSLLIVYTGSLDYTSIFEAISELKSVFFTCFGYSVSLLNLVGILLFIGAMSKSAQIPLQVWLPDSMVGPTPVSALMHAATMVTAGIYLVARLSPIFEAAPLAKLLILITGSSTALLFGMVALIQTDIKRSIAFSTISQLGYMTTGLGVSAYTASILHLVTHAYFKALLFLSAGSIILSLHEQSLDKMGGLWKRLPITYLSFIAASFALMGIPPFSGFYSKDLIISAVYEATHHHPIITWYAFYSLLAGILVTALYTGRLIFLIFHGSTKHPPFPRKLDYYINIPLLLLTVPTIGLGWCLTHGVWLKHLDTLVPTMPTTLSHSHLIAVISTVISLTGLLTIWISYTMWPLLLTQGTKWGRKIYRIIINQYGLEKLHQKAIITVIQRIAKQFAMVDTIFIDRLFVQGSTQLVRWIAGRLQKVQSGRLHQYLLIMIMGIIMFLIQVIIRA